ncbi:MAG: DUF2339 domain-containing protein [Candidatus Hydrogenedentales bacterium]
MVWWVLIFMIVALVVLWRRTVRLMEDMAHLKQHNDRLFGLVAQLRKQVARRHEGRELAETEQEPETSGAEWAAAEEEIRDYAQRELEMPVVLSDFASPETHTPPTPVEEIEERPPWMPPPIPESRAADVRERVKPRPAPARRAAYESRPAQPRPDYAAMLLEKLRKLGPDDPTMSFEMALGTYWLPRAGIVFLSIGVVFLLTLAAQKWGEPLRVAIGYAVAAGLLVGAWRLDRKYPPYARVLYAGGFALTYFVTFATYYIPYARIFDTPYPTLAALAVIVIAWGVVAQQRRSPTIAVLVTFLGHLTVGVATFSVDDPAMIAASGIVLLSAGSAWFLLRDRWYYVAALGMFGSYLNHFLLLGRSESTGAPAEFALGLAVLTLYFFIFALAELFAPEALRRGVVPVWMRTAFVTFNSAAYLAIGTLLVEAYDFSENEHHLFRYAFAIVLFAFALVYLLRRERDPLYNAYMTKAAAVTALGLAYQFSGASLTAWLAVEMVVLIVSARQSGLVVARAVALALALVALVHGLYTAVEMAPLAYSEAGYAARVIQSALAVLAFWIAVVLYQRMNWAAHAPKTLLLPRDLLVLLWHLDFVADLPDDAPPQTKPLRGLLIPFVLALAGAALFTALLPRLFPPVDGALVAAAVAVVLAMSAKALISQPLAYSGLVMAAVAVVWNLLHVADTPPPGYEAVGFEALAAKTAAIVVLLLGLSEFARRNLAHSEGTGRLFPSGGAVDVALQEPPDDEHKQTEHVLPILLAAAAALLIIANVFHLAQVDHRLLAFAVGSLVLTVAAGALSAAPIGIAALMLLPPAYVAGTFEAIEGLDVAIAVSALAALFATAVFSEARWVGRSPAWTLYRAPFVPYVLYGGFGWVLALFISATYDVTPAAYSIASAAVIAALLIHALNCGAMAVMALALFAWAQVLWHLQPSINITPAPVLGLVLLALAVAAERYFAQFGLPLYRPIWTVLAWIIALHFAAVELRGEWHATGWAIVAFAFLAYTFAVWLRTTAALAVAAGVLASAYHLAFVYYERVPEMTPLLLGFLLPVAFWLACERVLAATEHRIPVPKGVDGVFVAAAAFLLVLMLERIPALAEYYLTVSWSLLGMALFGLALLFHNRYYRYAGLIVLLLAAVRVVAVDTRELEPLPRVAAWAVLGAVLLLLGLGYVKAVARNRPAPPPREEASR